MIFRSVVMDMAQPENVDLYEEIKRSVFIDQDGKYQIISEEGHWTKDGARVIHLCYIEDNSAH